MPSGLQSLVKETDIWINIMATKKSKKQIDVCINLDNDRHSSV